MNYLSSLTQLFTEIGLILPPSNLSCFFMKVSVSETKNDNQPKVSKISIFLFTLVTVDRQYVQIKTLLLTSANHANGEIDSVRIDPAAFIQPLHSIHASHWISVCTF